MLYERWREVAARHPHAIALRDGAGGRAWTFDELRRAGEVRPTPPAGLAHPRGQTVEFVLELLAAWRAGIVACPLEPGQTPPRLTTPPDGVVHLKLTSGTADTPKLVALDAVQLAADVDQIVHTMGLRADWPNLGTISLAHSYGFSNLVLPLLLHGIPLVLIPTPLPAAVAAAAREFPDITLPAVPALWRMWNDAGAIPGNVRCAISAGAVLPLDLETTIHARLGLKIHNFMGASECGGIAYDRSESPRSDPGYVGTAMDGVRLERDDDGCLVVRSRAVARGYWPQSDRRLGDGVYRSHDLVELDAGGRLRLLGRMGDVINLAGRKVSPESIESALRTHPGVTECTVFGLAGTDTLRGETVVAVVNAPGLTVDALREHLQRCLPAWQMPREWWLTNSLVASARGKISRSEWRQRYQLGQQADRGE